MSHTDLSNSAFQSSKDEYADFLVYKRLSELESDKNRKFSEMLGRLADIEYNHYEFWIKYCPNRKPSVSNLKVSFIVLLRLVLGVTFAVKYLERDESKIIKRYRQLLDLILPEDRKTLEQIILEEEEHEKELSNRFEELHVRYLGFVVLGLADALVEIAGIHAGSLGIYNSTELAGLAGVVAGAAASIAMASAAYAQAKTGFKGSATVSALYTGISYFITAVILATPYFLTKFMLQALFASLVLAVLMIAFVSFYSSVISGTVFRKDFAEITGIMFGATVALYLLGNVIRVITGITI